MERAEALRIFFSGCERLLFYIGRLDLSPRKKR